MMHNLIYEGKLDPLFLCDLPAAATVQDGKITIGANVLTFVGQPLPDGASVNVWLGAESFCCVEAWMMAKWPDFVFGKQLRNQPVIGETEYEFDKVFLHVPGDHSVGEIDLGSEIDLLDVVTMTRQQMIAFCNDLQSVFLKHTGLEFNVTTQPLLQLELEAEAVYQSQLAEMERAAEEIGKLGGYEHDYDFIADDFAFDSAREIAS